MPKQVNPQFKKSALALAFMAGLAFVSLACSFGSADTPQAVRINMLSPLTPTHVAVAAAEDAPVQAAAPVDQAPAAPQPAATATPFQRYLPTLTPTASAEAASQAAPQQPAAVAVVATDAPPPEVITPSDPAPVVTLPPNPGSPTMLVPPAQNRPAPPAPPKPAEPDAPAIRPTTPGWAFVGLQTSMSDGQTHIVGEMINNTGAPQQNVEISGTFYGANDQVIQDELETLSYVPVDIIPVRAHVPFELSIDGSEPIYRLDLLAMSDRANDTPRQDFDIINVSNWEDDDGLYCLGGDIQNPGDSIQEYLVVLATAYDGGGSLISFGEFAPAEPEVTDNGQTSPFEMCLDPLNQQVAHYELSAMGF